MTELHCYNKGCGKKYKKDENIIDACSFHPGGPIFHDAYKGWSCCKKRSTDFTEFLNIPGCTKGLHNPEKPAPPKKNTEKVNVEEVITVSDTVEHMKHKAPTQVVERPSDDLPKIKLKYIVAASLKTQLQKHKERQAQLKNDESEDDIIKRGAPCKHNSCEAKYIDESSSSTDCVHHPGTAVFHEGYKFWSCCQKRTSDFEQFLKQGGCETTAHAWMKPSEIAEKKSTCRYDWHQTGNNVLLTVYAKISDPDKCSIEANQTGVHALISFNGGLNVFEIDLKLNGLIKPEESCVNFFGTKVEMKLEKAGKFSWPKLEFV